MAYALSAASFAVGGEGRVDTVIVLVPDGCGAAHTTLARWCLQKPLAVDAMLVGCVRTYAANSIITDSAPAASAFATGHKTSDRFIAVLPDAVTIPGLQRFGEELRHKPVPSILEGAQRAGKATGLVATSSVQHATPAAYSAHVPNRDLYEEIAEQQVHLDIDVVLGGGSQYLYPREKGGKRTDGQDLRDVLKARGYRYLTTGAELAALDDGARKVWGLFAKDGMAYDLDRAAHAPEEPSLAAMVQAAIRILSKNPRGFFLMVEGSKVDWASHAHDPVGVVSEVLAFNQAVAAALEFARNDGRTMVLVFSDHGNGGMSIGSRSSDGSYSTMSWGSVIGPLARAALTGEGVEKVLRPLATDADGLTAQEVCDAMERCYGIPRPAEPPAPTPAVAPLDKNEIEAIQKRIQDLVKGTTTSGLNSVVGPMISRRAHIGWTTTGHTGEDLFVYAFGVPRPLGTIENADIARICADGMGIDLEAAGRLLFVPALEAFGSKDATIELRSRETEVAYAKDTKRKVHQLVPTDLVAASGGATLTFPVGTDIAKIETRDANGWTDTIYLMMDGRTLYTAPYRAGARPGDPAPELDPTKVYVPRQAIELLERHATRIPSGW